MANKTKSDDNLELSKASQLKIPLLPDGSIDWDGMRGSQHDRILSMVNNDPTILEYIGMSHLAETGNGDEVEVAKLEITAENVGIAIDSLSKANAKIFGFISHLMPHPILKRADGKKVPFVIAPDILNSCFTLTEKQHKELDPRALRLAKKHAKQLPNWLKKDFDFYMLAAMFLKFQGDNATNAMKAQVLRDIATLQEAQRKRTTSSTFPQPVNGKEQQPAGEGETLDNWKPPVEAEAFPAIPEPPPPDEGRSLENFADRPSDEEPPPPVA